MRTIHFYIIRQVLKNLVMTILVLTMLFLIGNALKDILKLLAAHRVPPLTVAQAFAYLLPFVLVYTLPIGFLTATLMVFGRLSSDQELTAIRASGISLTSIVYPVVLMSILFCFLCAWVNLDLGPRGRVAFKKLLFDAGQRDLKGLLPEGRFITDFPGYVLYISRIDGNTLHNVLFYSVENGRKMTDLRADTAQLVDDPGSDEIQIQFFNPTIFTRQDSSGLWQPSYGGSLEISFPRPGTELFRQVKLSEMTLTQLLEEAEKLKSSGMTGADILPVKMHLHEKISFSFASLGFTLLGIPLGIQAHRRDTSSGVAIALALMLLYYGLVIAAKSLESRPSIHPHLLLWVPNILFQALGIWMILRKNRH